MAYVSLGQASQPGRSIPRPWRGRTALPWETDQPTPAYQARLRLLRKRRGTVTRQAQRARAMQLEGLGKFKLKKILKPIKKVLKPIYRPIVAAVKKFGAPLIAVLPLPGAPAFAAMWAAAQKMRASQKAQQQVAADVQQAPSWGTMTVAQQQAMLNAIAAGQVPSIQVPPDVAAAYQASLQRAAAAMPAPAPGAPGPPMMPEPPSEAAPAPTEAGIMGMGGMGTMAIAGAAVLAATMLMGGGGGRRR